MTTQSADSGAAAIQQALKITVLAGGPSAEREISLQSGTAIAEALRRAGHQVTIADISPTNLAALELDADLVFPALHGTFGEDGQVQALLEARGIRFVGSASGASRIGMNKWETKEVAKKEGIVTPHAKLMNRGMDRDRTLRDFPLPAVVKPVAEGSSVLTTIVKNRDELMAAVDAVLDCYEDALVEQFIAGREITVGIIGRTALPPIWVKPAKGFYDFHAKYRTNDTEYHFDCGLAPDVLERVSTQSVRLFSAIGCRHLARVDWIVDADNVGWLLEINTMPGFTSHSLVPKAAAQCGLAFDVLVASLVKLAMEEVS